MDVHIGTSGWSYDHWTDVLYAPGLAAAKRLARYAETFDTVELNASFYRWPADATFAGWRDRLPDGFTMSVKAHRGLTHFRRLADPGPWAERIVRCQRALGNRREAVLIQLRPDMVRDDERLEGLLSAVPGWIRLAVEMRHPSWNDEQVYQILHRHRAGHVVVSGLGLPCIARATTDFVYVRMHGPDGMAPYAGRYTDGQLQQLARQARLWAAEGRRVLVYFNNDGHGHAVRNALRLRELVDG